MVYEDNTSEAVKESDATQNSYAVNTTKKFIITYVDYIEKYPYKTTALNGIFEPIDFGFTDRYFGGQIHKCARVKGEPYVLLVSNLQETLGIYVPNEEMSSLTVARLKDLCTRLNLEFSTTANKDKLIELLTNK